MASFSSIVTSISNAGAVPVISSSYLSTTQVFKAVLTNTDVANTHSVTFYATAQGVSPSSANQFAPILVGANSSVTVNVLQGQVVQDNGSFQAVADANAATFVNLIATCYTTP